MKDNADALIKIVTDLRAELDRERAARRIVDRALEAAIRERDEARLAAETVARHRAVVEARLGVATHALCAVANREGRLRVRLARVLHAVEGWRVARSPRGARGRVWSRRLAP